MMESNHLTATLLNVSTGLQPATGNILLNTLFGMCVLKHSKLLRLSVRKECFNTIYFFLPQKGFHPSRRPFAPCFKCRARTSFPVCSHFAVYNHPWAISRFLTTLLYTLLRSTFSAIIFLKSCGVIVYFCIKSASCCFFLSVSIITFVASNKKPQGF